MNRILLKALVGGAGLGGSAGNKFYALEACVLGKGHWEILEGQDKA